MKPRSFFLGLALAAFASTITAAAGEPARRPNIIFISIVKTTTIFRFIIFFE